MTAMVRRSDVAIFSLAALLLAVLVFIGLRVEPSEQALCINELLPNGSILLADGEEATEWIELYNGTDETVALKGCGLSDDPDEPFKYVFGDISIAPKGFLLLGTTDTDKRISPDAVINFRLGSRGGVVVLTAPDGSTIDRFEYQQCYNEIPYGRAYDGGRPALLNNATPGYSNSASTVSRYVTETVNKERPSFSCPGGFYNEPFYLEIEHPEGTSVYYTTDGSVPDFTSKLYDGPLFIEDASPLPNRYAGISTTHYTRLTTEFAAEPVTKGTVIRARICRDGYLSEYTADATYFVGIEPTVTAVSIITDPDNLFGYYNGIYTRGVLGDYGPFTKPNYTDGNKNYIGNYTVRGKEAARPASVEIFEDASGYRASGQSCEIRINGGPAGAVEQVKSLRLYATSKYGDKNSFDINFDYSCEAPVYTCQLVLRTKRNFVTGALEDVISSVPFLDDGIYVQCFEPAALYINGEYWGITALRERINGASVAERYGIAKNNLALLKIGDRQVNLVEGSEEDLEDYQSLINYSQSHDMTLEESYNYIADRIDIDSFIRQQLIHIYYCCYDWPDNNIRMFRSKTADPDNPYADGKWHYVLYDMDRACIFYEHNTLLYAMGYISERGEFWDGPEPGEWSISLFRGLMDNAEFRARFLEIYKEYRAEKFTAEYMNGLLDDILNSYGEEFQHHTDRWTATPNLLGKIMGEESSAPEGQEKIEQIREFFDKRLSYMDSYMEDFYASKGEDIIWE